MIPFHSKEWQLDLLAVVFPYLHHARRLLQAHGPRLPESITV